MPRGSLGAALATLTLSSAPSAQPYELLPIVIESDSSAYRIALSQSEQAPPFARCRGACTVYLWPGEYWLTVGATSKTVEGRRRLELEEASRVYVTPIEKDRGSWLGIVGGALFFAGLGTWMYTGLSDDTDDDVMILPGVASFGAGIVVTLVASARANRTTPYVEIESLTPQ